MEDILTLRIGVSTEQAPSIIARDRYKGILLVTAGKPTTGDSYSDNFNNL